MADTAHEPFAIRGPIGRSIVRKTGRAKVTGQATYSAEWPTPEMLYAVPVVSTIAKGQVVAIDTAAALAMPGVTHVLTPENAPKVRPAPVFGGTDLSSNNAQSVIPAATREVRHAGQYVAAVIATSFESARDAALLVKITYKAEDHTTDIDAATEFETPEDLMGKQPVGEPGDVEAALASAARKVDLRYRLAPNHHNPIEPHATIAHFTDDGLVVYDATQAVAMAGRTLATMFGLEADKVRVICQFVGGAFGSKGAMWPHVILAVMCAKLSGGPVKLALPREMMYGGIGMRTPMRQRLALGVDGDNKLTTIIHEGTAACARKDTYVEAFTLATRMMYAAPTRRIAQTQVRLDIQNPTFMRAPAETPGMFVLETAIDEMAAVVGVDPIAFRMLNEPEQDPLEEKPFSGRHLIGCLTRGARAFGWEGRPKGPREARDGRWLIGTGVAAATYPYYTFPAQARVTIHANGTVAVDCCTQEIGTGTETAQAQLCADLLGLPIERVTLHYGDTTLPPAGVSGGSATMASVGGAIRAAVDDLRGQLAKLAKKETGLAASSADELTFRDGRLTGPEGSAATLEQILADAMKEKVSAVGSHGMPSGKTSEHSFGAQFVEVAVDEELGLVRVRRMLGCFACGTIVNARTARSQFLGGMVMGIGHALLEATHFDHRHGDVTNDNLAEYHVPVNADIPQVDVMWIDTPDWNASPIGAKGVGEIGITGVAAAVANAIWHATGKRHYELPITPEAVMAS